MLVAVLVLLLGVAAAALVFVRLRNAWCADESLRKWNEQRARLRQDEDA